MREINTTLERQGRTIFHRAVSAATKPVSAAIFLLVFLVPTAGSQILIGNVEGNAWDPLVGATPFFVLPGETQFRAVSVANNPFATTPPLTGPVRLSVTCCLDQITRSAAPASVTLQMSPFECRPISLTVRTDEGPRQPPRVPAGPLEIALPPCPADGIATVNIGPTTPGQAFVVATATSAATPGRYIATVRAQSALGTSTLEMFFSVVPAALPTDGQSPPCSPPTVIMRLSQLAPPPFVWKRRNPASMLYGVAAAFPQSSGIRGASGLSLDFTNLSPTGPISLGVTSVSFTNTGGRPVAMRTVDSRNCSAAGQQIVVPGGGTRSMRFTSATTTTLVFSKSTCRAWVDWFDCWGGSGLGLDDIVSLGEGSFWIMFGGRTVRISTAGDWGKIPRPSSVAVIRTP